MKRKCKKITVLDIKLLALAVFMRDCAADLEYYGGFSQEQKFRASWLADMAKQVSRWAMEIEGKKR